MNIILEWLDFTWKTNIANKLSKSLKLKLVTKDLIENILWDVTDINKWESTLESFNLMNDTVFDRHFLSLMVYWRLTDQNYNSIIDENKVFSDLIQFNKWSMLVFRFNNFDNIKKKINRRFDNNPDKISSHDIRLLGNDYFRDYSNTFHNIYNKFNIYNKKNWSQIKFIKQDASQFWTKNAVKDILIKLK